MKNNEKENQIMNITFYIKSLYSDAISEIDKKDLKEYIDLLNIDQLNHFNLIAQFLRYDRVINKINKSSIRLSKKIYHDTGLFTFTCVRRVNNSQLISGNIFYSWEMYLLEKCKLGHFKFAYGVHNTQFCSKKTHKLDYNVIVGGDVEIY